MRVGGREEIETDVRLVTATNRDLPALVREGKFREDLFMRLNVIQLRTSPLRERPDDIGTIADNWWFNRFRKHLTDEQKAALSSYSYPGNVRELVNMLERACVFKEADFSRILAEHREMNAGLFGGGEASSRAAADGAVRTTRAIAKDQGSLPEGIPEDLAAATRHHVRLVYEKYARNVSKAAAALNITRTTLRKWL